MDYWQEFERIAHFVVDYFGVPLSPPERNPSIVFPSPNSFYDYDQNKIYLPQNPNEFEFPEHVTTWIHRCNNPVLQERMDTLVRRVREASERIELKTGEKGKLDLEGAMLQRELMLGKSLARMVAGIGALGYLAHQGLQKKVIEWMIKMHQEWTGAQEVFVALGNTEFEHLYSALGYGYAADAHLANISKDTRRRLMMVTNIENAVMILDMESR